MLVRARALTLAAAIASSGCGLILDSAPPALPDVTFPDTSDGAPADAEPDAALDVSPDDVPPDAPRDVGIDASADLPGDLGRDIPVDEGRDVPVDEGRDVPADLARDMTTDVPADLAHDAMPDLVTDRPVDVAPDVPMDVARDVPADTSPTRCSARLSCPSGLFCNLESCAMDATGTCEMAASPCPIDLLPNCGCDGRTFSSECARIRAGVARRGPLACVPLDAGPATCRDNDGCPRDQYCNAALCDGVGVCTTRDVRVCVSVMVCGCDGVVYSSPCAAAMAGARTTLDSSRCRGCRMDSDCATGLRCCSSNGRCHDPACLSCCMFSTDAGRD